MINKEPIIDYDRDDRNKRKKESLQIINGYLDECAGFDQINKVLNYIDFIKELIDQYSQTYQITSEEKERLISELPRLNRLLDYAIQDQDVIDVCNISGVLNKLKTLLELKSNDGSQNSKELIIKFITLNVNLILRLLRSDDKNLELIPLLLHALQEIKTQHERNIIDSSEKDTFLALLPVLKDILKLIDDRLLSIDPNDVKHLLDRLTEQQIQILTPKIKAGVVVNIQESFSKLKIKSELHIGDLFQFYGPIRKVEEVFADVLESISLFTSAEITKIALHYFEMMATQISSDLEKTPSSTEEKVRLTSMIGENRHYFKQNFDRYCELFAVSEEEKLKLLALLPTQDDLDAYEKRYEQNSAQVRASDEKQIVELKRRAKLQLDNIDDRSLVRIKSLVKTIRRQNNTADQLWSSQVPGIDRILEEMDKKKLLTLLQEHIDKDLIQYVMVMLMNEENLGK